MDKEKMAREGQTRIDIWLPDDLRQRAAQAAAADHRSLSNFVRLAVEAACTKADGRKSAVQPHDAQRDG